MDIEKRKLLTCIKCGWVGEDKNHECGKSVKISAIKVKKIFGIEAPQGTFEITNVSTQPHYMKDKIQVMEFCRLNNYDWTQSNVIKYVARYKHKDGVRDLYKALDYLKCAIYLEQTGKFLPPHKVTINRGKVVKVKVRK